MQTIPLGVSSLKSSRLAYGCWRVAGTWNPSEVTPESRASGYRAIIAAYEAGYTLFDNADIYCQGEAERILGETLKKVSGMRDRVLAKFGRVEGLVNNSVLRPMKSPNDPVSAWEESLRVNATGLFLMTRAFGEVMCSRGQGSVAP